MEDKDFQLQVQKLIDEERRQARAKDPYILESLAQERQSLVMAFYDHLASLQAFPDITTADELLESLMSGHEIIDAIDWESETQQVLIDQIDELIQKDIEHLPELQTGELHVSGEGMYVYISDDDTFESGVEVGIFDEGMTIIGDINRYDIAPMHSYDTFLETQHPSSEPNEVLQEGLGVWVLLKNAIVLDGAGQVVEKHDEVSIPVHYPSTCFHKVIRQQDASIATPEEDTPYVDVWAQFKNDFIIETCNTFENDVNYNDYSAEERALLMEQYQDEVSIYMSGVNPETPLLLSASEALMADGKRLSINHAQAQYLQPVFLRAGTTWRIHHAFAVGRGDSETFANILPEHLLSVRPIHE